MQRWWLEGPHKSGLRLFKIWKEATIRHLDYVSEYESVIWILVKVLKEITTQLEKGELEEIKGSDHFKNLLDNTQAKSDVSQLSNSCRKIFSANDVDIKGNQFAEMVKNLELIRSFNAAKTAFVSPQKYDKANEEHEKKLLKVGYSTYIHLM